MDTAPLPLGTIKAAFSELKRLVSSDLRMQQGDAARLSARKQDCHRLLQLLQQHSSLFTENEHATIEGSLNNMILHLDNAVHNSAEAPDSAFLPVLYTKPTGRPGRPRIEIDREFLAVAYELRGPAHLGKALSVHPRTVRRRLLEQGLAEPAPPVYVDYEQEDGSITRMYRSSTGGVSDLNDEELDEIVLYILEAFPGFGRRMIDGHLKCLGHRIPRTRIQASYARVHGAPAQGFGPRRIERRVYSVAGPNALWHHDGQHGLIRWKFVIHAFIDGFSRFVVGIQVSSNNSAQTVLDVFINAVEVHGIPSRVRADYGTENVLVAALMEALKGVDRGSYIWGRSVHNVRIERLWRDITLGFGQKWREFFEFLEVHKGLNINLDAHIWLLHHVFSDALNDDAAQWAEAWNTHVLSIRGQRQRSPKDMMVFGMMEHGLRGLGVTPETYEPPSVELSPEGILEYGIDWADYDEGNIRNHHNTHNREDELGDNPFLTHLPHHFSHVLVTAPDHPFVSDEAPSFCWCDCAEHLHVAPEAPPNPPGKGGIQGKCVRFLAPSPSFTPLSLCGRPNCGSSWLAHDVAIGESATTVSTPSQSDASVWEPPFTASSSTTAISATTNTNDRRLQHSSRNRATTSAFSAPSAAARVSMKRVGPSHHRFPDLGQPDSPANVIRRFQSGKQKTTLSANGPSSRKYLVLMLPYGERGTTMYQRDDPLGTSRTDFRVYQNKFHLLIQRFGDFHLALEITINARPDDEVWQIIFSEFAAYLHSHGFTVPPYDLSAPITRYGEAPFVLCLPGYQDHRGFGQRLKNSGLHGYEITFQAIDKIAKKLKHPDQKDVHILVLDSPTSESDVTGSLPSQPLATSSSFGSGTPVLPFSGAEFDEDFNDWRSELLDIPISSASDNSAPSTPLSPSTEPEPESEPPISEAPLQEVTAMPPHSYNTRHAQRISQASGITIVGETPPSNAHLATPQSWQSSIPSVETDALSLTAPTVGDAAEALIRRIHGHHANIPPSDIVYKKDVFLDIFNYDSLASGKRFIKVDKAIGVGVERAVIRMALSLITQDARYWRKQDNFVVWALRPDPYRVAAQRLAHARTHGTLCALHILWLAAIPSPISPFLIFLAIHDFSSMIDTTWINKFDKNIAARLRAWPINPDELDLTSDENRAKLLPIISTYLRMSTVEELSIDREEHTANTCIIFADCLLGAHDERARSYLEIAAFISGFDLVVDVARGTFGPPHATKALLHKMDSRKITSPSDIITHLSILDNPNSADMANIFMAKFARYLRGKGHPSATTTGGDGNAPDFVTLEMRASVQENSIYRAERFLVMATGSDIPPTSPNWKIDLRFVNQLPQRSTAGSTNRMPSPPLVPTPLFNFHSCTLDVHIFDNARLRELLEEETPDDDATSTQFDLAVHSQLMDFQSSQGDAFNNL
ncbi:hypothetical protein EYR38_009390 [Pleurotus pulmonarius]|nr:hypothetical protein EYR38_009390 [Pleurotus pulmonarius]